MPTLQDFKAEQQELNQILRELRTWLEYQLPKLLEKSEVFWEWPTLATNIYIPDYATITAPLRELTKNNIAFKWENRHQKAFEQLKKKLTSTPVMAYFDTKKRSLVIVDGSPYGISAILAQKEHHSQQYNILSYASRALSPVETRYSQTDIEGLSLVWELSISECS
ncbi:Hypothetical predicted protein [Paramuricea clavata]|uniref:Uncharacterized protein n=1 Tax=Paramuricea clavata TaxID=317549 RepID=A0A6S7K5Z6_PARCT|nr:Hypothetical predicted protein [Paramuricea clavata]